MPSMYVEIEIDAPRTQVWDILLNKGDWVYWNTFLFDCDPRQSFQVGRSLLLSLKRVSKEAQTKFSAQVTRVQPNHCLQWFSKAPGYRIDHTFELQDIGANRTKYIHREQVSGLFTRVFLPFIRRDELDGMRRMAVDLKYYAEKHRSIQPKGLA